jgi:hypothetical protein
MSSSISKRGTLLTFFLISIALLPFFRFHSNPDAVAYLRIASYYQKGLFDIAVNGIWSPMISWLLVPFFAIGLPWMVAFRLLNILIATLCLHKLIQIIDDFFPDLSRFSRNCLILTIASQLLILHLNTITPDLLALCLVLFLLYRFLAGSFYRYPLSTGFLGAILYFAKAYCFYFFLSVIGLYSIYFWAKHHWRIKLLPIKSLLLIGLVFFAFSGIWIFALHHKYGAWELSTAPGYNYAVMDAKGEVHQPYDVNPRLMPLPYPQAFCLWEDPQAVFHLTGNLRGKNFFSVIGANVKRLYVMMRNFYSGFLLLIPLLIFVLIKNKKKLVEWFGPAYKKIIFFTGLYLSGYMLIFVEGRYIWLILFVIILLLFKCLDLLRLWRFPRLAKVLPAVVAGYFILISGYFILTHFNVEKQENIYIKQLSEAIPAESHFATWYAEDLWSPGYLYQWHHYGGIASYPGWDALAVDLHTFQVDYIIIKEPTYLHLVPKDVLAHLRLFTQAGDMKLFKIQW